MFLDYNNHFYISCDGNKKIYFNFGIIFEGISEKEAFSLFDNYDNIENKIKEYIDKIKKEENKEEQKKLEDEICKEIIKELDNFDCNKIKIKNGKYSNNEKYIIIHDNILEEFDKNNFKIYEGEFIQEIEYNNINILFNGIGKYYEDNYKGEFFYNCRIGRGKINEEEKFFFLEKNDIWNKYKEEIGN